MSDTNSGRRITVITGANRGLGLATARALAERGDHHVVMTGRSAEAIEAAVAPLREAGLSVEAAVLDVSSDDSVAAFFDAHEARHGRVDVLINNAGAILERHRGSGSVATFDVTPATVLEAFNANALGAFRMLQRALPLMNRHGFGRVVNVSSGMGALHDMGSNFPAYRISKTSLSAITVVFAHEAGDNVKVNVVCPGWVRTDMGGESATRSIEQGIAGIVWAATLPDDGPSGGFFRDGKPVDW